MATLTIEGQKVTVDDSFRTMSREDQERTVDEIANSLRIVPAAAAAVPAPAPTAASAAPAPTTASAGSATGSGAGMNFTAGVNEALYGTFGAPVDIVRGAMNLGIRGANAVTGKNVALIPEDSFGGSRSIAEGLGAIDPRLDPQNTVAASTGERIARGVGQGVAGTVAPAAIVGGASRAGAISPRVAEMGTSLFGRSNSVRGVAADAFVGGAAGAGSAAGAEAAPDQLDPIFALGGGLLGGGVGAVATGVPALVREASSIARNATGPMTAGGQQRLAAERLQDGIRANETADPRSFDGGGSSVRDFIDTLPGSTLVPGSMPTTGQTTGNMGLLAMERAAETKNALPFQQRRADQNQARVAALQSVQPDGAPDAVSKAVRVRMAEIDAEADGLTQQARTSAENAAGRLGEGMPPEQAGGSLRASLEASRATAKAKERAVWDAVDPDGTLALSPTNAKAFVSETVAGLPASAKPPSGEEAAIYGLLGRYGDTVPFSEVTALSSRLKAEMRAERLENGESPAYRRMSMLNSAMMRDFDGVVSTTAKADADAVAAGRIVPDQAIGARLSTAPQTGANVFTSAGRSVPVEYELVEAATLQTSNSANGRVNPAYPAELQPRDRTRAASNAQIATISRNLQPERLGPSADASTGAPIVGADGVVESGNGRVLALRRAYGENGQSAASYRDYLTRHGYEVEGFKEPVLVRRRQGDMPIEERARFAQEANANSSLAMSAGEQAAADASRLTPDALRLYRGGDPASAENRDFARTFMGSVADKGQEGSLVTANGALSLDGTKRIRGALLHSAYEDRNLIASLVDEGDPNIQAFGRSLDDLAGGVARLKSRVVAGEVAPGADLSPPLVEAARIIQSARSRGVTIADAVAQQDAFNQASPAALLVLSSAYGPSLTGRLSRERLSTIMGDVIREAEEQTVGDRLFGEPLDIRMILEGAQRRYGTAAQSGSVGGNDRQGVAAVRAGDGGSGGVPNGAAGAGNGNPPSGGGEPVLDRYTPNFDRAARDRLTAANTATRERVETFDNATLGPLRRRPSTTAPYDVSSAEVAARIFSPGAKAPEVIARYRAAVGSDPAANAALEGYAVDRLRRVAMNEDGTFNPAKLDAWRRSHADALRAFPELNGRIADAGAAAQTMAAVALRRKRGIDDAQRGALGKLMTLEDPADVTRTVGAIFGRQDSVQVFSRLRSAIGKDEEARQGLRKAVVDHMLGRFIGNTEAGTSGVDTIKSDGFQTFVRQNKQALRAMFSEEEIANMDAVAADLKQANRSIVAVKLPGRSNTAQDSPTMLGRIVQSTAANKDAILGATLGGATVGPGGMVVGAIGARALSSMREAGLQKVDDIVADALLNPDRAKLLLMNAPRPEQRRMVEQSLGTRYRSSAVATMGMVEDERRGSSPRKAQAGAR